MDDTRNEICRKVLETPLEDIREDVFFRADNFQDEPWYGEFQITAIWAFASPSRNTPWRCRRR